MSRLNIFEYFFGDTFKSDLFTFFFIKKLFFSIKPFFENSIGMELPPIDGWEKYFGSIFF